MKFDDFQQAKEAVRREMLSWANPEKLGYGG